MSFSMGEVGRNNASAAQKPADPSEPSSKISGGTIGIIFGIASPGLVGLAAYFFFYYLFMVWIPKYRGWRVRKWLDGEDREWFRQRDVESRRLRGRLLAGGNTDMTFHEMRVQLVAADEQARRGRSRRERGGETARMRPDANRTQTTLPRYSERDEGAFRVPEYERAPSLPGYEAADLERGVLRGEGTAEARVGELGIELRVLERVVVR